MNGEPGSAPEREDHPSETTVQSDAVSTPDAASDASEGAEGSSSEPSEFNALALFIGILLSPFYLLWQLLKLLFRLFGHLLVYVLIVIVGGVLYFLYLVERLPFVGGLFDFFF